MLLHQVLHGYRDGHRLLASSAPSDVAAARQILTLSDASGPGLQPDHPGYITGYPLVSKKSYALARTWPAPEMPRPGCVWTHTLLIDVADLATLSDAEPLLNRFRRPSADEVLEDFESYRSPLNVAVDKSEHHRPQYIEKRRVELVLYGLYGNPLNAVFWTAPDDRNVAENLILALWLQQWPRLRRTFRFCTLSLLSRSPNEESFDLQIVPQGTASRKAKDIVDVDDLDEDSAAYQEWVVAAADDLLTGGGDLRRFLWRYGADTDAGRYAFKPLTNAWLAFRHPQKAEAVTATIDSIEKIGSGNAIRGFIANKIASAAARSETHDPAALRFLVGHIDLVDDKILVSSERSIARAIYEADIQLVWQLVGANTGGAKRTIAHEAIRLLVPEDLESADSLNEDALMTAIALNPDLLVSALLWKSRPDLVRATLRQANADPKIAEEIVDAAVATNADFLADTVIDSLGMVGISRLIYLIDTGSCSESSLNNWMQSLSAHPKEVLSIICEGHIRKQRTLACLASQISYRASVEGNKDPWVRAVKRADGVPKDGGLSFCGFLLARALSGASPEPGKLLNVAFDPVYNAILDEKLDYQTWKMVTRELPYPPLWKEWDRCYRLILGAAKFSIDHNLSARQYLKITSDDGIFLRLARETADRYRGKNYLGKVLRFCEKRRLKQATKALADILESKIY